MKSILNSPAPKSAYKPKFPYLAKLKGEFLTHKEKSLVVLFASPRVGTVLASDNTKQIGIASNDWDMNQFVALTPEESITLSN